MDFPQLLKGIRNLEDRALGVFMEKYSPLIRAFIRKKVNPNDVDDAAQEFFYHILRVNLFAKFGGDSEAAFKAYLVKSALNFSFDWRHKEFKLNQPLMVFDGENTNHWTVLRGGDTVYEEFLKKETAQQLNGAILNLSEQYRSVIELKLLGYSNSEIAELLQQPLGSVNTWYTRGLKILADALKELNTNTARTGVLQ
jgi:RNA polymerase sigma factor (sigma-70 family)